MGGSQPRPDYLLGASIASVLVSSLPSRSHVGPRGPTLAPAVPRRPPQRPALLIQTHCGGVGAHREAARLGSAQGGPHDPRGGAAHTTHPRGVPSPARQAPQPSPPVRVSTAAVWMSRRRAASSRGFCALGPTHSPTHGHVPTPTPSLRRSAVFLGAAVSSGWASRRRPRPSRLRLRTSESVQVVRVGRVRVGPRIRASESESVCIVLERASVAAADSRRVSSHRFECPSRTTLGAGSGSAGEPGPGQPVSQVRVSRRRAGSGSCAGPGPGVSHDRP